MQRTSLRAAAEPGRWTAIYAQTKLSCSTVDNEVYDGRIQQVKGKVTYLNHPDLGKTPATVQYLVFQREDCKNCLIATHADIDGNYKIFVGVGRYKLNVKETRFVTKVKSFRALDVAVTF